ncbi:MAG: hypothetical protein M3N32_07605 [Actinomycetota bacterium]|nr:hypothetical protein [Actinomycetota bacterium]
MLPDYDASYNFFLISHTSNNTMTVIARLRDWEVLRWRGRALQRRTER